MIVSLALALAVISQKAPETELPGIWRLRAVSIDSSPATPKDMAELLKDHGGLKPAMVWRLRKPNAEGEATCSLNGVGSGYSRSVETKELIVYREDDKGEYSQAFDLRFASKTMQLDFLSRGRAVCLTFSREE